MKASVDIQKERDHSGQNTTLQRTCTESGWNGTRLNGVWKQRWNAWGPHTRSPSSCFTYGRGRSRGEAKLSYCLQHLQGLWARTADECPSPYCYMAPHIICLGECFHVLLRRLHTLHLLNLLFYEYKFKYAIRSNWGMILPKSSIAILFFSIFCHQLLRGELLKSLTLFVGLFQIYFRQFGFHVFWNSVNRGLHT